ncbi:FHA domain-containing protein [Nocardioides sp. CN2-186]|uniref:FHA domain-containing protein n=1 Tax=Nocardioides tweenelious TaxID=3156607 RepID=UPI0032B37106
MTDEPDRTWSYRRGDWFGIFGARAVVVLPPSEKARVARLWELLDDGAGFDETLDALVSAGLRELPGFVLVSELDDATKIVIRGAAHAHVESAGEVVHVQGDRSTTWVERSLPSVTRIRVEVGDGVGDDEREIGCGLVRLATAELVSPAPPDEVEHHQFVRHHPGIPGQPRAPQVTARPVARLVLSTGETVDVDRAVLVGRAPEPRRDTTTEQPRLVTVASPQQEISSTHLEVRPGSGADHGSAIVTDLGSTNGTQVTQPGLPVDQLTAGVAVQLIPGALIDLGDGVTIEVVDV